MNIQLSSQRGFSLIELLIVVTIIGILAAIAVPYLLHAKQAARGASAISTLRLVHTSEVAYHNANGGYGDLAALGAGRYISDPSITAGTKSEYNFNITVGPDPILNYSATGTPIVTPTAYQHYFIDETGLLRFEVGAPATAASAPVK